MSALTHARLTRDIETPGLASLDGYRQWGGYKALEKGVSMAPGEIAQAVSESGLRGRGGAGFPTGRKWSLMPQGKHPRYIVANADESEPGTFKDRYLMERNPHLVIEGLILAARAVEADQAFIYVRGEYAEVQDILEKAVDEAHRADLWGDSVLGSGWGIDIIIHGGAGAYICGEENALLESLEGNRGRPRPKPPYFPAAIGVYDAPTALNNVETLANVPYIVEHGPDEYKSVGTERSSGTRMLCLSGHVNRPGVYEVPQGIPAMTLINELGGGMLDGKRSPDEQLVSCCSCLVTPDGLVSLSVVNDLISNTLTGVRPSSVVVKLISTIAGTGGSGTSCTNSAATASFPALAIGLAAWGTTIHASAAGFATTETAFTPSTLSAGELASVTNRCTNIIGNGSTFGICRSCRAGGLGAARSN